MGVPFNVAVCGILALLVGGGVYGYLSAEPICPSPRIVEEPVTPPQHHPHGQLPKFPVDPPNFEHPSPHFALPAEHPPAHFPPPGEIGPILVPIVALAFPAIVGYFIGRYAWRSTHDPNRCRVADRRPPATNFLAVIPRDPAA
jgi:hypothetical protein